MRFKLEEYGIHFGCPTYNSKMLEGKFRDTAQRGDVFVYANISDFNSELLKDADLYVYAHPFRDMCNAEDYDITANLSDSEKTEMKAELLAILEE